MYKAKLFSKLMLALFLFGLCLNVFAQDAVPVTEADSSQVEEVVPALVLFAPVDVKAYDTPNDDGKSISLEWGFAPNMENVTHFNIYRVEVGEDGEMIAGKEPQMIGQMISRLNSFTDYVDQKNQLYRYYVTSYNSEMNVESEQAAAPEAAKAYDQWYNTERTSILMATLIFMLLVLYFVTMARRGKEFFIRKIAGIAEIDNALGRATEMGRPVLFVPGLSGISDVATIAGLNILGRVAKKTAEYETPLYVPNRDYIVLPIAQEIVRESYAAAGRPDAYREENVFFVSTSQFAYVAGVNGLMIREKTATNFYMGMFWAESLLLTETGSETGAIQIAGTDADAQLPFFITTCDYTLIGEELYAASAYLGREPLQMGTLKAQDYAKLFMAAAVVIGTICSTFGWTGFKDMFPSR